MPAIQRRGLDAATILTAHAPRIAALGFVAVGRYLKSLTDAEIAEREAQAAQAAIEQAEREAAEAQKQANKESAKSKLEALGLSEDEINALIG